MTFYDDWLGMAEELAAQMRQSPGVSHDADLPWETTRQDARVKLMLADELGFPMMGGVVLKAEIPPRSHTGLHVHGEEAIYVVSGTGFARIDGRRFDVREGSAVHIPYRTDHQLVNTGDEPLLYVSAMALPLERFVKLGMLEQLEDRGENTAADLIVQPEAGHSLPDGRRVIIHLDEAPTDPGDEPTRDLAAYQNQHYAVRYLQMRRNGFAWPVEVAMTHVFEEPAGYHAGKHKHLEAVLYVLDGEGFSEVGGREERWSGGDCLHVPPAMAEHEHYNMGDRSYRLLRIQFGIRYWFTDIWPQGYTPQRIYDADGKPIVAGWIDPARAATEAGRTA
jgi:mannose-6-phosphate isomerase-like protein (cupin superfamily)